MYSSEIIPENNIKIRLEMKLIISIAFVVLMATAVAAAAVRPSALNLHGYESLNNEIRGLRTN